MSDRSNDIVPAREEDDGSDESSWTQIIVDFERGIRNENNCEYEGSSVVSDISLPELQDSDHFPRSPRSSKGMNFKKMNDSSLRKRRKVINTDSGEDPFEDTASSHLNTPQVDQDSESRFERFINLHLLYVLIQLSGGISLDRNAWNKENHEIISDSEVENSSTNPSALRPPDRNLVLHLTARNEISALNQKGLCLVPSSILRDFMG